MADDSNEQDQIATATAAASSSGQPTTKLPKGVVLDKNGKPCRTCTSASEWKELMKMAPKKKAAPVAAPATVAQSECPPDVETLGRSSWTLLHSIAATYPETPSRSQQSDVLSFVSLFSRLYPCWVCAEDFQGYLAKEPPRVGSRNEFGLWLCGAHNDVNRKLGKPIFDCSKWEERWRTGWKDGRCD
ncbi:hypothetical protein S40285_05855 [Stachybotrys chlorohalonatus IBT 40285]|uniref:Sulfhydryl oxidase n=1 Tax=Stachybotrys chlorohalonatus (strain IBT 40285) TaxID=1283841 RepID=A0A084QBL3_STAC4|nr:hypothetical protein S40285_05855 [Stachybotrys chlorohalonata IBT 40285]